MKKATKVLFGISGILAICEVFGTLGEVQALSAMWEFDREATEKALDNLTNKKLHKELGIHPVSSAKAKLVGNLTKAIVKHS